ncbi:hypothetical protein DFH06DRAFT_1154203, partial [Mycena polygramma]
MSAGATVVSVLDVDEPDVAEELNDLFALDASGSFTIADSVSTTPDAVLVCMIISHPRSIPSPSVAVPKNEAAQRAGVGEAIAVWLGWAWSGRSSTLSPDSSGRMGADIGVPNKQPPTKINASRFAENTRRLSRAKIEVFFTTWLYQYDGSVQINIFCRDVPCLECRKYPWQVENTRNSREKASGQGVASSRCTSNSTSGCVHVVTQKGATTGAFVPHRRPTAGYPAPPSPRSGQTGMQRLQNGAGIEGRGDASRCPRCENMLGRPAAALAATLLPHAPHRLIETFRRLGRKVVFLGSIPSFGFRRRDRPQEDQGRANGSAARATSADRPNHGLSEPDPALLHPPKSTRPLPLTAIPPSQSLPSALRPGVGSCRGLRMGKRKEGEACVPRSDGYTDGGKLQRAVGASAYKDRERHGLSLLARLDVGRTQDVSDVSAGDGEADEGPQVYWFDIGASALLNVVVDQECRYSSFARPKDVETGKRLVRQVQRTIVNGSIGVVVDVFASHVDVRRQRVDVYKSACEVEFPASTIRRRTIAVRMVQLS